METIFLKTETRNTHSYHIFRLIPTGKRDQKYPNKNIALANLSIYYTWENIKSVDNSNEYKISAPPWSNTFSLHEGTYSISDIQNYFEYIIEKHKTIADNPTMQIHVKKSLKIVLFSK